MKALTVITSLSLAAIVLAQSGFTYRSPKVDPKLIITGKQGWVELDKSFEVTSGVKLESKTDLFILTGDKMSGDLVKEAKKTVADHLRVRGNVTLVKQEKKGSTRVTANEADYDLINATQAKAILRGGVKFNFSSEDPKTGNSDVLAKELEATFLRKPGKDEDSLIALQVVGPLSYTGVTAAEKGKSVITARADQMTYKITSDGGEMRLSGNLYFDQKGPGDEDSADVSGAQSVILNLNKAKEVVRIRMSSDKPAKIVTKIRKKSGSQS